MIRTLHWKSSSFSFEGYYSLKSIKLDLRNLPLRDTSSSQKLLSVALVSLAAGLVSHGAATRDAFEHCFLLHQGLWGKERASHISFPVPGPLGCLVYNLLGSVGNGEHVSGFNKRSRWWRLRPEKGLNATGISGLTQKWGRLWRSKLKKSGSLKIQQ